MWYWLGSLVPIQLTAGLVWRAQTGSLRRLTPCQDGKRAELSGRPLPLCVVSGCLHRAFAVGQLYFLQGRWLSSEESISGAQGRIWKSSSDMELEGKQHHFLRTSWQVRAYGHCGFKGKGIRVHLPMGGMSENLWPSSRCTWTVLSHLVLKTITLWGRYP